MALIDIESKLLSNAPNDIDKLRKLYITKEDGIRILFVSPYLWEYEKHRHYLLKHSIQRDLDSKYYYRPDYLSFDAYGSVVYWQLLLFMNNVSCIEEFKIDSVIIPNSNAILELVNRSEDHSVPINLDVSDPLISIPKVYEPTYEGHVETSPEALPKLLPWIRETYILSEDDINNQYIILGHIPIISSIICRVKNEIIAPIYDVHWNVKMNTDTAKLNIFTWHKDDVNIGVGLKDKLLIDSILEIQYQIED